MTANRQASPIVTQAAPDGADVPPLIRGLMSAAAFPHAVSGVQLVQTHISWVLLTGDYAYKIKKPVRFSFLDFSTLERRETACREELRLNRLMTPELYLDVVPIVAGEGGPKLACTGIPIEYALRMRQFSQHLQLDRLLQAGELQAADLAAFGGELARLHAAARQAAIGSAFGEPAAAHATVLECVHDLRRGAPGLDLHADLDAIEHWLSQAYSRLARLLLNRKMEGRVRECHGDLHLPNLVKLDGAVRAFDRIEFSEELRWIDVISDIAFLVMDLDQRGHPALASGFLNAYLETGGDYQGMRLLNYYLVYRALVRAKVALIRCRGACTGQRDADAVECARYVQWAARRVGERRHALLLMHGFAGSGKSWLSRELAAVLPAVQLRSDVERKRLNGLGSLQRSGSAVGAGIYTSSAGQQVYSRLAACAEDIIEGGATALVDAAFLKRADRQRFMALARRLRVPFAIIDCRASQDVLERRVAERLRLKSDASEAGPEVLHMQRVTDEPLDREELTRTLSIDTAISPSIPGLVEQLRNLPGM